MWGGGGGCIYLDRFPNQSYWDFLLEKKKMNTQDQYPHVRWLSLSILTPVEYLTSSRMSKYGPETNYWDQTEQNGDH